MIQFVALEEVPLSSLRFPGGFRERFQQERVKLLAERLKARGQIEPLLVRDDYTVLDGLDRGAAAMIAQLPGLWCVFVECSDIEAQIIMRESNMHRRHDPQEQRRLADELVEKYAQEIAEQRQDPERRELPKMSGRQAKRRKRGRKKGVRAEAMEKVAKELGISVEALRKSEYRKRAEGQAPEPEFHLKALGMELPAEFVEESAKVGRLMERAARYQAMVLACLTELGKLGNVFPAARLQRLYQDASDVASGLRNAKPTSVCPFCKALDRLKGACSQCSGTGRILSNQESAVPKELMDETRLLVQVGGQMRSVWDYVEEPAAADLDSMFGGGQ